jgi:uncharacterized membrane protein SirB2
MTPNLYHFVHVFAVLVLTGYTFFALAGPAAATRKRVLMATGIASLLILVSGIGLMHKLTYQWQGWVIVKIVVWLAISAFAGIAYRRPGARGVLGALTVFLSGIAVYMVFYKPF